MEFENNEIIEEKNKFISLGKINDKFALIFSKHLIEKKLSIDINNSVRNDENSYIINHDGSDINLVYPCEEEHLKHNKKSKYVILKETAQDYNNIVLPYIKGIYNNNVKWIYDIIHNGKEKENIFLNIDEFLIIKNLSWTNNLKKDFYILVISKEPLMTIRDLRKKHVPLLKLMKEKCIEVAKKFKIDENQLYFFFHYHPSFYHLHLHCCIINNPELSSKYFRCKMLETIICNLEKNSHYYKNNIIMFEIPTNHAIAKLLS